MTEALHITAGIQYSAHSFVGRRRQRNLLSYKSQNLAHSRTELEAFLLYIDESMLLTIQKYTNRKVNDLRHTARVFMSPFTLDEIKAAIGILLSAGADRDNFCSVRDLWDPAEGRPFYRAVMFINRFKFFIHAIHFDNYRDRAARLQNDRLAAISEVWNKLVSNLRRFYVPGDTLTVVEQLVGYRGTIPGRTYVPSKPRKYGVKIFLAMREWRRVAFH